jgi:hypothetical protein
MAQLTIKTISAENTFTDAVLIRAGYFSLSIQDLVDSTVTVQKSYDQNTITNWEDVDTFAANAEDVGFEPEDVYYRAGVKTGDYGTDDVIIRIGINDLPNG